MFYVFLWMPFNYQSILRLHRLFEASSSIFLKKHIKNLSIATLNINSIVSKFNDLLFLLNDQLVDVLSINESKLTSSDDLSTFEHPNYDLLRRDRQINGGGGVLVYVKKNLNVTQVLIDENSETIGFVINAFIWHGYLADNANSNIEVVRHLVIRVTATQTPPHFYFPC